MSRLEGGREWEVVPCWGGPKQAIEVSLPLREAFNELYQVDGGRYVLRYGSDGKPFYLWVGRPWPLSRDTLDAMYALLPGQPFVIRLRLKLLRWLVRRLLPKPHNHIPSGEPKER